MEWSGNGAVNPYDLPPIGQTPKGKREREREFFHVYTYALARLLYCQALPHILPPLSLCALPALAIVLSL